MIKHELNRKKYFWLIKLKPKFISSQTYCSIYKTILHFKLLLSKSSLRIISYIILIDFWNMWVLHVKILMIQHDFNLNYEWLALKIPNTCFIKSISTILWTLWISKITFLTFFGRWFWHIEHDWTDSSSRIHGIWKPLQVWWLAISYGLSSVWHI